MKINFKAKSINLTDFERNIIIKFFGPYLLAEHVYLFEGGWQSIGSTRTLGNCIFWELELNYPNKRGSWDYLESVLIHECVHVLQYYKQTSWQRFWRPFKTTIAQLWHMVFSVKKGGRNLVYRYELKEDKNFWDYNIEQQATMMEDLYNLQNFESPNLWFCKNYQSLGKEKTLELLKKKYIEATS